MNATAQQSTTSNSAPGKVTVTIAPGTLGAGIYNGDVNIAIGSAVRTVNVTLILTPGAAAAPLKTRSADCAPSRLSLTQIGTTNQFSVPAGWPATLSAKLLDNCGTPVNDGFVFANFSNGDPPISLVSDQLTGTYSATWAPGATSPQMNVSLTANAGQFDPVTSDIFGGVASNAANPPTLIDNAIRHAFEPQIGGPLSPGGIATVAGNNLSRTIAGSAVPPIATSAGGTSMLTSGFDTPLYQVTPNLLTVQIPAEIGKTTQQPMTVVITANALTLPQTFDLVPVKPGLSLGPNGLVIAQHSADFSPIDPAHPARSGEIIILYLTGMGPTSPSVASGQAAPTSPLAETTTPAKVLVNGQSAEVVFAGMTPQRSGLYQVNIRVPSISAAANVDVVVLQGRETSATSQIAVAP